MNAPLRSAGSGSPADATGAGAAGTAKAPPPWSLVHGASWLTETGEILVVPGFHEEWIAAHRDLVGSCANVCEVVLRKCWISVAVYSEGYVELLAPRRGDSDILARIERLLGATGRRGRTSSSCSWTRRATSPSGPGDFGSDGRLEPGSAPLLALPMALPMAPPETPVPERAGPEVPSALPPTSLTHS